MNDYQNKKEQFTSTKKNSYPIIIGIVIVLLVAAGVIIFFMNRSTSDETNYYGEPVAESRSYIGQVISMTSITPEVKEDKVIFPLEEVDSNNIVYFELENDQGELVPIMAYLTPTGRLFVGSSMCEPCRGQKFSLAGETLVCDTCKTTYNIETHEFLSGAAVCGELPPVNMNPVIENGNIVFDYSEVLQWRIRE